MRQFIAVLCFLLVPLPAMTHHAVGGNYDSSKVIELEGEVVAVLWRNPHVQVTLRVNGENGEAQNWDMATTALSNMRRWQLPPEFIKIGEVVRVAGNPGLRNEHTMYIRNVLTTSGEEVLLGNNVEPIWTNKTIEMAASRRAGVGDKSAPELGIFRIWSTPDGIPMLIPRNFGKQPEYRAKLTDAARAAVDAFVWERDNPLKNCSPKGMPMIMEAPYPFEFVRDGENILWHDEEFDTVRTIHMAPNASADGQPDSLLGYSIGRWEGERTLVVTTTHMGWGHFDGLGVPITPEAVMVETFAMTPQGDRLDYSATVSDPAVFTEPVTLGKHWVYFTDAVVGKYDCLRAAED
jgi:Family of unknown function (DUF6152)